MPVFLEPRAARRILKVQVYGGKVSGSRLPRRHQQGMRMMIYAFTLMHLHFEYSVLLGKVGSSAEVICFVKKERGVGHISP